MLEEAGKPIDQHQQEDATTPSIQGDQRRGYFYRSLDAGIIG